jgi:chitosanase
VRIKARTAVLAGSVAVALSLPLALTAAGAGATSRLLLSTHRPVVASSVRGTGFAAGDAIDANASTRWESAPGPGTQWLRIDLGRLQRIDRVTLRWEGGYAKSYRVQTSLDGANWSDVYRTSGGDGGVDDLKQLSGQGRYVRVLATQRGRSAGGYSLWEMLAYGPAASAPLALASPASGSLAAGLDDPHKREIAFQLVSSAENSTLDWRREYGYIEDIHDGRGYTAGIIGFCSGTSDMLALVTDYTRRKPANPLARYLPALRTVDGSASHAGLDPGFPAAWRAAAADPVFQKAQEDARDGMYFRPSTAVAKKDGLRALGQFAYYDAAVVHGVDGMRRVRTAAMRVAKTPAQGGDELAYLTAFLNARVAEMRTEAAHSDTTRIDTAQRVFLQRSNLDLTGPLTWKVYGDSYRAS